MIGKLASVVLDCPEPRALAGFYCELLGMKVAADDGDFVDIGDGVTTLSFQRAPDHQPPRWPDPAYPQQFHIDVQISGDIEQAEQAVLALGATKLNDEASTFRVYADPAGHPFCLCWG